MSDLPVRLYGRLLGVLSADGAFEWEGDALRVGSTALSQSLRFGHPVTAEAAANFFGALLPEGRWRTRLADELHVDEHDYAGMLAQVGRDLAGALVVGDEREHSTPEPVDRAGVATLLRRAGGYLVGGGGSALTGFQRKIALTRSDGGWLLGNGALPSTHILKPVDAERRGAAYAEHYTLALAREIGLTTFDAWVEDFDDVVALVVERYDRRVLPDGTIGRVHQEDAAQALSLAWFGSAKFEEFAAGASLRAIAGLLDRDRSVFARGATDVERLLAYTTFNVAVGNTDAHAKNFSILRPDGGRWALAPLYDAAPIALDFEGRKDLALCIDGVRLQADVTVEHLVTEAMTWGVEHGRALDVVTETLGGLKGAVERIEPDPAMLAKIPGFIHTQVRNLLSGRAAGDRALFGPLPPYVETRIDVVREGDGEG
jgi:serine/threonine-protein kinase HipA